MGTDKSYPSSFMEKEYTSEQLSSEILKTLKSFITDDDISSAIITVPAKFNTTQIDATQKAAELAGFSHVELLQEPIAASMAYGLDAGKTDGFWLVFDFGGGTFDSALIKVEEGIMKVRVWQNSYDLVDETIIGPGQYHKVPPGVYHQFECVQSGVAFELYWAEFNHNDIKRETVGHA